jgi:aspartate ammonia-lyase
MPGKVNPVIPEFAAQAGYAVFGFDGMVADACAAGNLELDAFLPLAAWAMLSSIEILERAGRALAEKCVIGITPNPEIMSQALTNSTASAIVLVPVIGHDKASELAQKAIHSGKSMEQVVLESGLLSKAEWDELIRPERLNAIGESGVKREEGK